LAYAWPSFFWRSRSCFALTGAVAIEHRLHQLLRFGGDLGAPFVECEVHLAVAGNLAHRRLRDLCDDVIGLARVERIVGGALQVVLDRKLDIDDVFVVSQEQRFLGDLVPGIAVAIADLDGFHLREIDDLDRLDRERQMPPRSRRRGLGIFAEAGDDAAPAFVDDIEAARQPDDDD